MLSLAVLLAMAEARAAGVVLVVPRRLTRTKRAAILELLVLVSEDRGCAT